MSGKWKTENSKSMMLDALISSSPRRGGSVYSGDGVKA